jgi:hypothetical protein
MPKDKKVGGNGYAFDVSNGISGFPTLLKYTSNCSPIFRGELLQNGGSKCQCGGGKKCSCGNNDPHVFEQILENIQQTGGKKDEKQITQFSAIKTISEELRKLSPKELLSIPVLILEDMVSKKNTKKAEQLGGYALDFQQLLAPLGRNNLLVLAALLLLHYFAVEKKETKLDKTSTKIKKGGYEIFGALSKLLAPLGVNAMGASVFLVLLQGAFSEKYKKEQIGGNPLKNLIAPLGTEAFIATGLLIILERMYTNKMKEVKAKKSKDSEKIKLFGGKLEKSSEKLFNLLSPISFNAFARQSFLDQISK